MKTYKFVIMIFLIFLSPVSGNSEEIEKGKILSQILSGEKVIAMNYWHIADEELLGIVTSNTKKNEGEALTKRKLSFYKKTGDKLIEIYSYETLDNFLGMYPLRDTDGNMVTVWIGGTGYHFNVFSFLDNEIKLVLEAASKAMPEIVDIDNDNKYEILIWEGTFEVVEKAEKQKRGFFEKERIFKWKTAHIYKWNGKSYQLHKTVPWKDRLNCPVKKTN